MDSPIKVDKFMNENLYLFEDKYKDVNRNVLTAAIAYKYLLAVYLNVKDVTLHEVLIENEYDIGLIGPGHSCLTSLCEKIGPNHLCHLHSILHNCYGRLLLYHNVGHGYVYMFHAPNWMKCSPFFGHISGLLYLMYYSIHYYREYKN